MADPAQDAQLRSDSPRIVIVGAGFVDLFRVVMVRRAHTDASIAGITMAINLKAKLHFTNFVVRHVQRASCGTALYADVAFRAHNAICWLTHTLCRFTRRRQMSVERGG